MKWRFIIFIALVLLLGNVQNYKELTDLAIVSCIGIDLDESGDYNVSVQVINSKKSSGGKEEGGNDSEITVYKSKSSTIQEALRLITRESPKRLHLANLELLVISEEAARSGIEKVLDFFLRNTDVNNEFMMVISKEKSLAEKVVSILTPIEKNPTLSLKNSLETFADKEGGAVKTTASYALDEILKEYKDVVITSVEVVGEEDEGEKSESIKESDVKTKVLISDVAFFVDGKLKGYLSCEEAIVYNIIANDLKNSIITATVNESDAAFEIIGSKCKINVEMKDDLYNVNLDVNIKANLSEIKEKINTNEISNIHLLENALKSKIEQMVKDYLEKMIKEYKVDVCGFGEKFYKKYGNKFKEVSNGYIEKLRFKLSVKTALENEGSELITR